MCCISFRNRLLCLYIILLTCQSPIGWQSVPGRYLHACLNCCFFYDYQLNLEQKNPQFRWQPRRLDSCGKWDKSWECQRKTILLLTYKNICQQNLSITSDGRSKRTNRNFIHLINLNRLKKQSKAVRSRQKHYNSGSPLSVPNKETMRSRWLL